MVLLRSVKDYTLHKFHKKRKYFILHVLIFGRNKITLDNSVIVIECNKQFCLKLSCDEMAMINTQILRQVWRTAESEVYNNLKIAEGKGSKCQQIHSSN